MTDRERLLKILNVPIYPHENVDPLEAVADYLLDNGVTFSDSVKELIEAAANQRSRAQYAEDFVCKLCAECEWEENDGISAMIKKCCNWFPECKQFKIRSNWIPVTEPPEERDCYFVTVKHWLDGKPVTREAYWNGADWLSCDKRHELTPRVTHWMPLPEGPKEEV